MKKKIEIYYGCDDKIKDIFITYKSENPINIRKHKNFIFEGVKYKMELLSSIKEEGFISRTNEGDADYFDGNYIKIYTNK